MTFTYYTPCKHWIWHSIYKTNFCGSEACSWLFLVKAAPLPPLLTSSLWTYFVYYSGLMHIKPLRIQPLHFLCSSCLFVSCWNNLLFLVLYSISFYTHTVYLYGFLIFAILPSWTDVLISVRSVRAEWVNHKVSVDVARVNIAKMVFPKWFSFTSCFHQHWLCQSQVQSGKWGPHCGFHIHLT